MNLSPAAVAQMQKIQAAKRSLEELEGKRIKEDKITEWALLDICESLQSIAHALHQAKLPR